MDRWNERACFSLVVCSLLWRNWLPLLTLVAFSCFTTPRWQLIPAYLGTLFEGLIPLMYNNVDMWLFYIVLLLVAASWGLCEALPLFQTPEPSGQYYVGTRVTSWTPNVIGDSQFNSGIPPWRCRAILHSFWCPNAGRMTDALCKLFRVPLLPQVTFCIFPLHHFLHKQGRHTLQLLPLVGETMNTRSYLRTRSDERI